MAIKRSLFPWESDHTATHNRGEAGEEGAARWKKKKKKRCFAHTRGGVKEEEEERRRRGHSPSRQGRRCWTIGVTSPRGNSRVTIRVYDVTRDTRIKRGIRLHPRARDENRERGKLALRAIPPPHVSVATAVVALAARPLRLRLHTPHASGRGARVRALTPVRR